MFQLTLILLLHPNIVPIYSMRLAKQVSLVTKPETMHIRLLFVRKEHTASKSPAQAEGKTA